MDARFTLTIELGNEEMGHELQVAMALDRVSEQVARGETYGPITDTNGNTVGHFVFEKL